MLNFEEQPDEPSEGNKGEKQVSHYDPLLSPWPEAPSAADDDTYYTSSYQDLDWWSDQYRPTPRKVIGPVPGAASHGEHEARPWDIPAGHSSPSAGPVATAGAARSHRRLAVTVREVVETLLLALLIFLAVRTSLQNFRVEGASMMPSMQDGEYLIVNKLAYAKINLNIFDWLPFFDAGQNSVHHLWDSPSRGDVIVFRAPTNPDRDFIKRVIGIPGDTVEIDQSKGQVRVNGEVIQESYIQGTTTCSGRCETVQVPEANTAASRSACGSNACFFVMGDNRQNSTDSRQGWLVPEENIVGKALITYWQDGAPELKLAPNHAVTFATEASGDQ